VAGELRWIEARGYGAALDRADIPIITERARADFAALVHRAEHGPGADRCCAEPRLQRLDRAQMVAARDSDLLALARLVGLAAPDHDAQPVADLVQILDLERDQLGAPERAREAEGVFRRAILTP
jgi:hypothetical protein